MSQDTNRIYYAAKAGSMINYLPIHVRSPEHESRKYATRVSHQNQSHTSYTQGKI
jgi:hypothetical protein